MNLPKHCTYGDLCSEGVNLQACAERQRQELEEYVAQDLRENCGFSDRTHILKAKLDATKALQRAHTRQCRG